MTDEEFLGLEIGDIVRHVNMGSAMIVIAIHVHGLTGRKHYTVVHTMDMSNPPEWDLIKGSQRNGQQ